MAFQVKRASTAFALDGLRQKKPRLKDAGHLAFIRTLPSLVPGREPVEAAHIRYADDTYAKRGSGLQQKPHDCWAVPLAADQHRLQHAGGERAYWERIGIDPIIIAAFLYAHSGDEKACIQIIRNARAISRRSF